MASAPMRSALRSTSSHHSRSSLSPVRHLTRYSPAKAQVQAVSQQSSSIDNLPPAPSWRLSLARTDATAVISPLPASAAVADAPRTSHAFFDSTGFLWVGVGDDQPPDPNKAKLGKTLRILQERLPTLLQSPLPQDILAPNISLHLFPSTHPHLPTVSGRVAYNAALWTSPIAWNRVPIFGNVRLEILAERITSEPLTFLPRRQGAIPEQLVIRWCEKRKSRQDGGGEEASGGGIARSLGLGRGVDPNKAFTGLFMFDFDKEGRILSHTIETAQGNGNWEKGVGAKFVGITDWLLGGIRDPGGGAPVPMFERIRINKR